MNRRALIAIAGELLHEFRVRRGSAADRVAAEFFRQRPFLGPRDRAFVSNTYFHALRHLRRLDEALLAAFSGQRIVAPSLLAGFPVSDPACAKVWQGEASSAESVEDGPSRAVRRATRAEKWIDIARCFLAAVDAGLEKAEELQAELVYAWPRPKKLPAPQTPEEKEIDGGSVTLLLDAFVKEALKEEAAEAAEPATNPEPGSHRQRFDEDMPPLPAAVLERMATTAVDHARSFEADTRRQVPERRFSFPTWLWGLLGYGLRPSEMMDFAASLNREAPLTLRVNTLRATMEQFEAALCSAGVGFDRTARSPHGIQLHRRVGRDRLPHLEDGWFEFQDESSQLCAIFAAPQKGSFVLDACAGGGGKALHLAALMEDTGTVLCLDGDPRRLRPLYRRRERAGARCIEVSEAVATSEDVAALEADMILLDCPCSGTGTLRRNPGLKWRLSPDRVQALVRLQAALLDFWAPGVRVGGVLVYATCSLLREENEQQVEDFLARTPGFRRDPEPGRAALGEAGKDCLTRAGDLMLYPHRQGCDGFYAARLVRTA